MRRVLFAFLFLIALAAPAAADDYTAQRFDARIEVLEGGSLRVTETIVFRFDEDTFTKVFRVIPTRRTDGVEFVSASMDGVNFPVGPNPGQVSVRRKNGLRIEWLFPEKRGTTHTFVLSYIARGVASVTDRADVIAWRALPNEHKYRIESSTVELVLPAEPIATATVEVRRVGVWNAEPAPRGVTVSAKDIGRNGWIELSVPLPRGAILAAPPQWQQRRQLFDSYRTPALVGMAIVLFAATILLFGIRQSYDPPRRDMSVPTTFSAPPDGLRPALAGAVASNGGPKAEHAFGALFGLAQRGVISVEEEPGTWGTRSFKITRRRAIHPLAPHEQAVLDTVFRGNPADSEVTLSKARSHITMRFSKFRDAVVAELAEAGLLDSGRQQVRRHYNAAGVGLLILGALAMVPVALLFDRAGPWLFLIPAGMAVAALISFITASAHTPLSNEGVRRSAEWRAYAKFLRDMPADARRDPRHSPTTLLPFAVALGLGMVWSKLYKSRAAELPSWFRAASAADGHRAFVAFVGTGGATASHGGGGGGGGAAGGGASGAS